MTTFQEFLESRNIDQQVLTDELRNALIVQWQGEQPVLSTIVDKPNNVLVIPDDIEERWQRAVRMEVLT